MRELYAIRRKAEGCAARENQGSARLPMDLSNVLIFAIAAAALWFGPRLILDSLGRTGETLSVLFVPPDWKMGWPRGVQEGDADWGWRAPAGGEAAGDAGARVMDDPEAPLLVELIDGSPSRWSGGGGLVVEPRRVVRH
jgi:hypothetical protein